MSEERSLVLPPFGKSKELTFPMEKIIEAESRFPEVQMVNPATYVDLEHSFNEAYRELRKHLSVIGFQITQAQKELEMAKADVLLGSYADFMKDKPKYHDNADNRSAFLIRDEKYVAAMDRVAQLKAIESHWDGKVKALENVSRYMRKKIDLILRSGLSGADLYNTQRNR